MTKRVLWGVIILLLCIIQIVEAQPGISHTYHWNADGSRLVMSVMQYPSFVVTVYDAEWQVLASRELPCCGFSISPDGKSLLINSDPSEILDIDTLQPLRILSNRVGYAQWSADGSELLSFNSGPPAEMTIYSAADGQFLRSFGSSDAGAWNWTDPPPARSPDRTTFAAHSYTQLVLLDGTTGKEIRRYTLDGNINALSWSSDSRRIAISLTKQVPAGTTGSYPRGDSSNTYYLSSIAVMNVATGEVMTLQSGFRASGWQLIWSPDGSQIATWIDDTLTILDSSSGLVIDTFTVDGLMLIGYSPTGGRLFLGIGGAANASQLDELLATRATDQLESLSEFNQTALDGMIQILVPAPSLDLLESIETACVSAPARIALPAAETLLKQSGRTDDALLTAYIDAVRADATIPAACAADLIAVAEALQGE